MAHTFSVPAADMIQASRTMRSLFLLDQALFEALDAEFGTSFATDWQLSIDASEAFPTAETRTDLQKQETEEVKEAMKNAGQVFATSKYFVEKAFAGKPNVVSAFGLGNYGAAGNQAEMSIFLANLYTLCSSDTYKPDLLAAGMTEGQINSIKTALNTFDKEDTEQNTFIKLSPQETEKRDAQYNGTYSFDQKVNRASKVVFWNNVTKLNQYALPHGSAGEVFDVEGKVTDGTNNNAPLKGVLVEIKELEVSTLTNFYGNYGFVGIAPGSYTLSFTLPGYGAKTVPFTLVQDGKVVVNATMQVL